MPADGITLTAIFTLLLYLLGALSSIQAIMSARTPQAAIAWTIGLCSMPLIALPVYWAFGRRKFYGYLDAHRAKHSETSPLVREILNRLPDTVPDPEDLPVSERVLERLAALPFTHRNQLELLIDGRETFPAIFDAIDRATDYVLIQFYTVRHDATGMELQRHLLDASARGVSVLFLYDEIGSTHLATSYLDTLRDAGVHVSAFRTRQGIRNRFQINFRNHRKIVVTDGTEAYVGGLNVGDEYLGKSPRFGAWRDTHVKVQGPSVLAVQLSFVNDWFWAVHAFPELNWSPEAAPERDEKVLVLPSGPSDHLETWKLTLLHSINTSNTRLWLVSPYFVPDSDILSALQLAALRGVDIRIMLPEKPDHRVVYLAGFTYLPQLNLPTIHFFHYTPGFLHQKVLLKDLDLAIVGTANTDNRSFRLNFELGIASVSPQFISSVETMLLADFAECKPVDAGAYHNRPFRFRLAAQVCRLFAPLL